MNIAADINNGLRRLRNDAVAWAVRGALDAGAAAAYDVLARYPPQRPPRNPRRNRYRRTGKLRQKLAVLKLGDDRREVRDTASYYSYVWGSAQRDQAWMHVGIWPTRQTAIAAAEREGAMILRTLLRKTGIVQ